VKEFDTVIIGGGAAALAALEGAIRRRSKVCLVSDSPLGGDCTFTGCVPSKTLIEQIRAGQSFEDALRHAAEVIATISALESATVQRSKGATIIEGKASLTSATSLQVDGTAISASRIILASGSEPAIPPIEGLATSGYLTNETFFAPRARPSSLLVIGGGAIGCELGSIAALAGIPTVIVEAADRLLVNEDPLASRLVKESMERRGVRIHLSRGIERIDFDPQAHTHVARLSDGSTIAAEEILVATGRRPSTEGLDLARAGIELTDRGAVRVSPQLQTSAKTVFAAGDVTGLMLLTHAADEMGRIAERNASSSRRHWRRFHAERIPSVIFTDPEVASIGLSERNAAALGARVAYLPFRELDRAMIAGRPEGYIKLIAGPNRGIGNIGGGRLLGASIVGAHAGEMIHELALAITSSMLVGRLAQTVHAYPTWSVAIRMAAAQFFYEYQGRSARPASENARDDT
jgi:pyruvate/2-oxoglutarate dehydrogenase complex dihydrolipoamide dehydrogenase (E3) component